ncbi:hypothetical protein OTERR_04070 [Oryzomicrobium terrae]|uniref:Tetratricopeptide repeat protein n=2 Tax=Oryzomicrobium terrae TaxID=1735038 RepID=A0A5C1E4T5_9RHOO|nr:hypothetical protein OTERR_04070 [Oryzomicrobium terrae]
MAPPVAGLDSSMPSAPSSPPHSRPFAPPRPPFALAAWATLAGALCLSLSAPLWAVEPGAAAPSVAPSAQAKPRAGKAERSEVRAARPAGAANATGTPGAASAGEVSEGQGVYQLLIGEFAVRRGQADLATSALADLAVRTGDPKILARTVEVAGYARRFDVALEAAQRWVALQPDALEARQALVSLLVVTNRFDELPPQLAYLLEREKAQLPANLLSLNRLFPRGADRQAALRVIAEVVAPYSTLAESHFALAQAAINAGDLPRGRVEIGRALAIRPDWENAALVRAQLLAREDVRASLDSQAEFLDKYPKAKDVRLHYARQLVLERRFEDAQVQFRQLLKDEPDRADVVYAAALLAVQQRDYAFAETQLKRLLDLGPADPGLVRYQLGQLAEEQKKPEAAVGWYRQVGEGEQFVPAKSRAAQLLVRQGDVDGALALLKAARVQQPKDELPLLAAEAQVLRDANRGEEGLTLLDQALARAPNNPDLLYDSALLAERMGKVELSETRLKKLIAIQPDHAHAYNALGYSYAERNVRLGEARRLIEKAVELAPEDPFIIDSLGWVLFRQGDLPGALVQLQKAYALRADPEIAAHLGEVLWGLGRQDEARGVWKEAASRFPDNDALSAVQRRLQP